MLEEKLKNNDNHYSAVRLNSGSIMVFGGERNFMDFQFKEGQKPK